MNSEALLQLPAVVHRELIQHLLREPNRDEQAAFVFAQYSSTDNAFHFVEWLAVPPEGFAIQLPYHFELTDATRATIIKRAHDLGASTPRWLRRIRRAERRPWALGEVPRRTMPRRRNCPKEDTHRFAYSVKT